MSYNCWMPLYLYECSACEKTFEVEHRITADALTDCPCGSKGTVKRLIQPVAVMFKGDGFYINDSLPKAAPEAPAVSEACTGTPAACPACAPTESA